KIAKAKASADAAAPQGLSPTQLALFYYNRGAARSFLVRTADALADAQKALEIAKGKVEPSQISRIRQLIALQYQAQGDPKQAMGVVQTVVNEGTSGSGTRGSVINASRSMAQTLVALGDVSQADAFARRVASFVQEARGSPLPKWRAAYPK